RGHGDGQKHDDGRTLHTAPVSSDPATVRRQRAARNPIPRRTMATPASSGAPVAGRDERLAACLAAETAGVLAGGGVACSCSGRVRSRREICTTAGMLLCW